MSDFIDLLTDHLHEHQHGKPEEPNERYPAWYHDRYEQWQRQDQALRLLLGVNLVERALDEKGQDA